jgi:hypothetical protein
VKFAKLFGDEVCQTLEVWQTWRMQRSLANLDYGLKFGKLIEQKKVISITGLLFF